MQCQTFRLKMYSINLAILITILCILYIVTHTNTQHHTQLPPSPCPSLFKYEARKPNETDRWFGEVILTTDVELFDGIWLILVFDKPSLEIQTSFAQRIYKLKDTEYLIKHLGIRLRPDMPVPVRFGVIYNPKQEAPKFVSFRINTRPSCPEPKRAIPVHIPTTSTTTTSTTKKSTTKSGTTTTPSLFTHAEPQFVTSDELSVTVRPFSHGQFILSTGGADEDGSEPIIDHKINPSFYPGDIALGKINEPTDTEIIENNKEVKCGIVNKLSRTLSAAGQWPWHAAIYNFVGSSLVYTCGGTLISSQHILTAAHCVTRPGSKTPVDTEMLVIFLGKHNLKSFGKEVQAKEVSKIIVHPSYHFNLLYNNLATLILKNLVTFTNYVRPICIWEGYTALDNIHDYDGTTVGWGFNEHKEINYNLRHINMPIIPTEICVLKTPFFPKVIFEKNYCAGFRNDTYGGCNGDSGSGMYFPKNGSTVSTTIWQLRGLVSISSALQGHYICDRTQYIVFTDVAKYTEWIRYNMMKRNQKAN